MPTLTVTSSVRSARGGEHTDEGQRGLILSSSRPSTSAIRDQTHCGARGVLRQPSMPGSASVSVSANIPPSVSAQAREKSQPKPSRLLEERQGRIPTRKEGCAPGRKPRSITRPTRSSGRSTNTLPRPRRRSNIPRAKPAARAASRRSVRISTTGWSRRLEPARLRPS